MKILDITRIYNNKHVIELQNVIENKESKESKESKENKESKESK
jgi:hypothetical protein